MTTLNCGKYKLTFTLRRENYPPIYFDNVRVLQSDNVAYLGLTFNRRMNWGPLIKNKRNKLNLTTIIIFTPFKTFEIKNQTLTEIKPPHFLIKAYLYQLSQIYSTAKMTKIRTLQAF